MDTIKTKETIKNFLHKMAVEYDSLEEIKVNDSQNPTFIVITKESGPLIGSHGETLEAMNYLLKQIIKKSLLTTSQSVKLPYYLLDINYYYTRRIETILYHAQLMAERTRLFKRETELEPMNPFERMIVHSHFSQDSTVKTESYGDGNKRRVVIKPIGAI